MNELTTANGPPTEPGTSISLIEPEAMISMLGRILSDPATDVSKVREVLTIIADAQERQDARRRAIKAEEARIAYDVAMNLAQADMPAALRDKDNPHTRSKYSRAETVIRTCKPIWTKHGFALTFYQEEPKYDPTNVRTALDVTHIAGHTRHYELEQSKDLMGAKGSVNKTSIQAQRSSQSYARRTMTLDVFNIATEGEDDDGNLGREDPPAQFPDKQPPSRKQTTANTLPEPIARDENSWLGKAEKWIDGADGEPAWIKRHEETAKKCPTLGDLNNLEDDFARAISKAPPTVSTAVRAAWAAARKRLSKESNDNTDKSRQSASEADSATSTIPTNSDNAEFVLHDETGDVMGSYATALEYATEFMDLWRIADDPQKLEEANADDLADARGADAGTAKILAELGTSLPANDPLLLTVGVPMKNGKQDWAAYRLELRKGLRDATDVQAWFAAQRPTLSGASKAVQQMSAKDLLAISTKHDPAPAWLTDMLPKAAKPKHPPVENDPRSPEEIRADTWAAELKALTVDDAGRKVFTEMVLTKGAECRETMIRWKANNNPLFNRVDPIVREKAVALGIQ
jgi:hypothetical protein